MRSNIDKLVYGAHSPQNRPVANGDMSGHLGIVAHYTVITNYAIMRQVAIRHYQAIFPNHGFLSHFCSSVDCYVFADRSIISNANGRIFTLEFKILRNGGDNGSGKNATIFSDARTFHDGYIRTDPCSFTNFHILVDNCKWIHFYIRCQPGIWMNISMRMNHEGRYKKVTLLT